MKDPHHQPWLQSLCLGEAEARENVLDWDLGKPLHVSEIQCLNLQTGELDQMILKVLLA